MSGHYRNYKDVLHKLESIPMFGRQGKSAANFSLEPIRNFCEKLGNPQNKFRSVHVAGTNGKGTTCRMLASVYQEAGYRTGLYTSPHLADYRERFTVNSKWIPKQYLLRFFQEHSGLIESHKLTYFELSTAVAYWYFSEMETDVAILETGLGGRLDATNIVKPMVSVITSVGLDHTDLLGDTVEMIAAEKAGIIKPNTPVVAGQVPEAALEKIRRVADSLNAPLLSVADQKKLIDELEPAPNKSEIGSLAARLNRPSVLLALHCSSGSLPVSNKAIESGLTVWQKRYPAGAAFRKIHPLYPWYFDAAHNTEALGVLKQQLREIAPLKRWIYVMAIMNDKLTPAFAEELDDFSQILYYQMDFKRAASIGKVRQFVPGAEEFQSKGMPEKEWVQKYKSELVIFGGSFYFYETVERWMENIADL